MPWKLFLLPLLSDKKGDNSMKYGIPSVSNKGTLCVTERKKENTLKISGKNGRAASSLIYGCSSFYV